MGTKKPLIVPPREGRLRGLHVPRLGPQRSTAQARATRRLPLPCPPRREQETQARLGSAQAGGGDGAARGGSGCTRRACERRGSPQASPVWMDEALAIARRTQGPPVGPRCQVRQYFLGGSRRTETQAWRWRAGEAPLAELRRLHFGEQEGTATFNDLPLPQRGRKLRLCPKHEVVFSRKERSNLDRRVYLLTPLRVVT